PKLRHFVHAQFAEPFSDRIDALVRLAGLARQFAVVGMHCAKLVNLELPILHSGAVLHMKERARRLQSLSDENDRGQKRKNNEHDRQRDRHVDRAFQKPVQWIFERFFAQANETKAAVFKVGHGMTQSLFQVAQNEKADAKLITNLNHILVCFGKKRKFEENDLSNVVITDDLFELLGLAEQGNSDVVDLIVVGN